MTKNLITFFAQQYQETVGLRYEPSWGRDGRIIKELKKSFSEDQLEEIIRAYFKMPYRVFSLPYFKAGINEVLQAIKNQEQLHTKKPLTNPDSQRYE